MHRGPGAAGPAQAAGVESTSCAVDWDDLQQPLEPPNTRVSLLLWRAAEARWPAWTDTFIFWRSAPPAAPTFHPISVQALFTFSVLDLDLRVNYTGEENHTHVMTSFRDSMAFSSVILSGFSSDVCFLMSASIAKMKLFMNRWIGGSYNM